MPKHQTRIARGAYLSDCIRIARGLDCEIENVCRTGEIRFGHNLMPKRVKVNGRRKSAPRPLTTWLNDLIAILQRDLAA
jgi:hypothetical protein